MGRELPKRESEFRTVISLRRWARRGMLKALIRVWRWGAEREGVGEAWRERRCDLKASRPGSMRSGGVGEYEVWSEGEVSHQEGKLGGIIPCSSLLKSINPFSPTAFSIWGNI